MSRPEKPRTPVPVPSPGRSSCDGGVPVFPPGPRPARVINPRPISDRFSLSVLFPRCQQRRRQGGRTARRQLHHGNRADRGVRRVLGGPIDRFPGGLRVRQTVHQERRRQFTVPRHRIRIFRTTAQHERVSVTV